MDGKKRSRDLGFTLIEITIAVFILAVSLVTLIGLQSSILQRSISDRNEIEAMLVARRILAAIESNEEPVPPQELAGSAAEVLRNFVTGSEEEEYSAAFQSLQAELKVEDWEFGESVTSLRRVKLRLSWSENPADSFNVFYFIPNEEEDLESVEPVT